MSSEINRGETHLRPSFEYPEVRTWQSAQLEMIESLRNVAEDLRQQLEFLNNKQMLQCDVRYDIKKMRIALEKIARNTARRKPKTKGQEPGAASR